MALAPDQLYRAHVQNLNAVKAGVRQVERELRAAISRRDQPSSEALLKILLLVIGSWAECRLRKLLYEPNGFDPPDREYITRGRQQLEWWKRSIERGFRKRYRVPRAALPGALRPMARMLYSELQTALDTDLKPIIEMRNTLAHGQWAMPLTAVGNNISGQMVALLRSENALSARFKMTILDRLAAIIHDLVSGHAAFERDFDQHYGRLETARRNLQTRHYVDWEASMVRQYVAGQARRARAARARAE